MTETTNIKLVETTPVTIQPQPQPGWQTTAFNEVRNGAWAVLLVMVIGYTASKGIIGKYLEKHMGLLDTMKESFNKNSVSLEHLAKAEDTQNTALQKQGEAILKQGEAIAAQQQTLMDINTRQKEVVSQSFGLLQNVTVDIQGLAQDRQVAIAEHQKIAIEIVSLKEMAENHQQEVIEKLQTIEDLYHASEEATGNKGTLNNFWRRKNDRK